MPLFSFLFFVEKEKKPVAVAQGREPAVRAALS